MFFKATFLCTILLDLHKSSEHEVTKQERHVLVVINAG